MFKSYYERRAAEYYAKYLAATSLKNWAGTESRGESFGRMIAGFVVPGI